MIALPTERIIAEPWSDGKVVKCTDEAGMPSAARYENFGERAGARTQDPVIKSHVLYRLSYALPWPPMASKRSPSLSDIREACLAAALKLAWRGKPAVSGSCCRPALCRGSGCGGQ